MNMHKTSLLFALLATAGAQVQAERRPDWEQALALAPLVQATLPLPDPGLPEVALDQALAQLQLDELVLPDGAELAQAGAQPGDGWEAVQGGELDTMRGGFNTGSGLVISLGLQRLVSINGELVTRTSFELPGLGGVASGTMEAAREALNKGALIQNGPGNIAPEMLSAQALGATVIQNTLNDQTIRSQTIINASVNSATLMQSLNFSDSVGQAIRDAVRPN